MTTVLVSLLMGCSDYNVRKQDPVPPAPPPQAEVTEDIGNPPDWADCTAGYLGHYYNLTSSHPDLQRVIDEPDEDTGSTDTASTGSEVYDGIDPDSLDWWDEDKLSFERFDASLDQGANWWPVDEGLASDPSYFAGRWTAWVRFEQDAEVSFVLGANTDVWVYVNNQLIGYNTDNEDFEPEVYTRQFQTGQYPLEILYAHRSGTSAMRFRFLDDHVTVCYPDFDI